MYGIELVTKDRLPKRSYLCHAVRVYKYRGYGSTQTLENVQQRMGRRTVELPHEFHVQVVAVLMHQYPEIRSHLTLPSWDRFFTKASLEHIPYDESKQGMCQVSEKDYACQGINNTTINVCDTKRAGLQDVIIVQFFYTL
jgi:hypothetical protein